MNTPLMMTITLPDGTEVVGTVTEMITKKDNTFFSFESTHQQSGESFEVRIETKDNFDRLS